MKNSLFILLVASIITGCGSVGSNEFRITGTLENASGVTVYLDELNSTSIVNVDSAVADGEGRFELTGLIEEAGFYKVRLAENNFVNIVLHPQDDIKLAGDASYLYGTYTVEGSRDAIALYELNEYLRVFGMRTDSMRQVVAASMGGPDVEAVNLEVTNFYNDMLKDKSDFLKKFIDENTSSISALAAVEGLDPSADLDYFVKLDKELNTLYPKSLYVKNFHVRVVQMSRLAIGSEAPQILLNNPAGETIALSSLRGKIVLIDFWASWCKPCRFENPKVVQIYNEYKDKGFEIYGVSLDRQKGAWIKAIQQDGLEWIHVSDLGFWNSAPVKIYDISSIPQTYLIDRDGKIIAKGLRAPELKKKLAEIFG